ncbi:hypothetical protein M878_44570 [Streptomyces roseochromogenus subsp. oscitans DS 12.976]|uniref:Uncharacterized protein n=1 Tax=Streptomyces roseochromogenus subsp. oscitans DS 12.976 TaxID=1352936 RepID=V6JHW4_STRRC|nr:hypothetical protein M878_44570 [Streptomyces roseochromogenus subsp. oscitans DS 12.976]
MDWLPVGTDVDLASDLAGEAVEDAVNTLAVNFSVNTR